MVTTILVEEPLTCGVPLGPILRPQTGRASCHWATLQKDQKGQDQGQDQVHPVNHLLCLRFHHLGLRLHRLLWGDHHLVVDVLLTVQIHGPHPSLLFVVHLLHPRSVHLLAAPMCQHQKETSSSEMVSSPRT